MPKVTMIGAGSAVFARTVMTDILAIDGLDTGTFALVDIDPERLELARQIAERLVDLSGKRWTVEASTDRTEVLAYAARLNPAYKRTLVGQLRAVKLTKPSRDKLESFEFVRLLPP